MKKLIRESLNEDYDKDRIMKIPGYPDNTYEEIVNKFFELIEEGKDLYGPNFGTKLIDSLRQVVSKGISDEESEDDINVAIEVLKRYDLKNN
jgi:hypothetical protein